MNFRKVLTVTAVTTAALATAAFSGGHSSPEDQAIGARNAVMSIYSYNSEILGGMAKDASTYNAEAAMAAAQSMAAVAGMPQMHMWTDGTDNATLAGKTRALPAIWENADDFAAKEKLLADAAAALAATAGDGAEAIGAGMREIGAACGACHKTYRGPRI